MRFADPLFLLIVPLALLILFLAERRRREAAVLFSNTALFSGLAESTRVKLLKNIVYLRALALVCICLALARPQAVIQENKVLKEGIDIVLSLDVSSSMLAEDDVAGRKKKNRIETAKDVMKDFIRKRPDDRIGLVAFAAAAYAISPLTFDQDWIRLNIDRLEVGVIEDATAIGEGILAAVNRIKDMDAKGKVVILLTDGRNNAGDIDPTVAAEAAKALKVKIYTIGVGSQGKALYPVIDPFGKTLYRPVDVDLDEAMLRQIAAKTGAVYFRADDAQTLRHVYEEIDRLEKRVATQKIYYDHQELFHFFLFPGLFLLLLELLARYSFLRRAP